MAKRIIMIVAATLSLVAGLSAQTAPAPGIEFLQRVDTEYVDYSGAAASTFGTDTLYSRSELKGSVVLDLGGGLTLTPSFKDRLEVRLNPSNTDADVALEKLGTIRDRNRLYMNLDAGLSLGAAFNMVIGMEGRLETDLRTDKDGTVLAGWRLTPTLGLNGKIDIFYYSLSQALPYYLDSTSTNNKDDSYLELEGTYTFGLAPKLDDLNGLKLDLTNYLLVTMPAPSAATTVQAVIADTLTFRVSLLADGGWTPSVGFIFNNNVNNAGVTTDSVVGGCVGLGIKKGSWAIDVNGDLGINTAAGRNDRLEGHVSVILKIKA